MQDWVHHWQALALKSTSLAADHSLRRRRPGDPDARPGELSLFSSAKEALLNPSSAAGSDLPWPLIESQPCARMSLRSLFRKTDATLAQILDSISTQCGEEEQVEAREGVVVRAVLFWWRRRLGNHFL